MQCFEPPSHCRHQDLHRTKQTCLLDHGAYRCEDWNWTAQAAGTVIALSWQWQVFIVGQRFLKLLACFRGIAMAHASTKGPEIAPAANLVGEIAAVLRRLTASASVLNQDAAGLPLRSLGHTAASLAVKGLASKTQAPYPDCEMVDGLRLQDDCHPCTLLMKMGSLSGVCSPPSFVKGFMPLF